MRAREGRAKVLLVEDRLRNSLLFEAALRDMGLEVAKVESGAQALLEAARRRFAVILLDRRIPGDNALETAHALRRREGGRSTPIIFTSATPDTPLEVADLSLDGDIDYCFSPVNTDLLGKAVRMRVDQYMSRAWASKALLDSTELLEAQAAEVRRLKATLKHVRHGIRRAPEPDDPRDAPVAERSEDPW